MFLTKLPDEHSVVFDTDVLLLVVVSAELVTLDNVVATSVMFYVAQK